MLFLKYDLHRIDLKIWENLIKMFNIKFLNFEKLFR